MTGFRLSSSFGKAFLSKKRFDASGKSYNDWIPAIKLYSLGAASASSNITNERGYVHGRAEGDTEPPAVDIHNAVLYNSYNSAVKRLFKALKSIEGLYNRLS